MKILKQYYDLSEAETLAEKLESKGIVTYISSKRSHELSRIRTGAFKVGLWAVLDHQFQDAMAFLSNSKHKITTGVSPEEMVQLKKQAKVSAYNSLNKFLIYTFCGIGLLAFIIYLIVSKSGLNNGV